MILYVMYISVYCVCARVCACALTGVCVRCTVCALLCVVNGSLSRSLPRVPADRVPVLRHRPRPVDPSAGRRHPQQRPRLPRNSSQRSALPSQPKAGSLRRGAVRATAPDAGGLLRPSARGRRQREAREGTGGMGGWISLEVLPFPVIRKAHSF